MFIKCFYFKNVWFRRNGFIINISDDSWMRPDLVATELIFVRTKRSRGRS